MKMNPFHLIHPDYESLKFLKGTIVIVEGIPGSGKSTLCMRFAEYLNSVGLDTRCFEEHVNESFLELLLSDMKKYAFAFQMSALANRQRIYMQALEYARKSHGIAIVDRSLHGDISFAALHHSYGNISDEEWQVYKATVNRTPLPQPSKIIYLDVSIDVAMERIHKRSRGSEVAAYDKQYLCDLDINYKKSIGEIDIPVMYINWNQPRELNRTDLLGVCEELHD